MTRISFRRRTVLGFAAALVAATSFPAIAADLTELRIAAVSGAVMPQDFRAAIKEGIFERHGLKIVITELATGTNNITATINGSADIAYADVFAGLASIKNGFDIGFVSPHNTTTPAHYFLVKSDSAINSFADINSKTVLIGAPPQFRVIGSAILEEQGADASTVNFTIVPDQTTFGSLLQTGQADVISTSGTILAYRWIGEYGFRTIGNPDELNKNLAAGSPIAGWWATRDWFEKNRDAADRFRAAIRETIDWYGSLPNDKRAEYVKEQTGLDLVALDAKTPGLLAANTVYFAFGGPVDLEKLSAWIALGVKYAGVPADVDLERHIFETARN